MPDGFVYFIRQGPIIKIGYSRNLRKRVTAQGPCEFLGAFPGDGIDERAMHTRFGHLALLNTRSRELFTAAPELLDYIAQQATVTTLPPRPQRPQPEPSATWWNAKFRQGAM